MGTAHGLSALQMPLRHTLAAFELVQQQLEIDVDTDRGTRLGVPNLLMLFDERSSLGLVRLRVRKAATELAAVLDARCRRLLARSRPSRPPRLPR